MNKSAIIALLLIIVMLGSSLTAGLLQSFNFGFTENKRNAINLPNSLIIDYDLEPEVKAELIRRGVTILRFSYSLSCQECLQIKNYLESFTYQERGQLLLVELISNSTPELTVSSLYGELNVYNLTQENVFATICSLMLQPPINCAILNLK